MTVAPLLTQSALRKGLLAVVWVMMSSDFLMQPSVSVEGMMVALQTPSNSFLRPSALEMSRSHR